MKIRTTNWHKDQWTAFDEDTYDGAPDAGCARTCGLGNTKETAIEDLIQQFENGAPWQQEEARKYRGVSAMTTAEVLREARRLIEHGWMQRDYKNRDTDPTCFCMAGAVWHVLGLNPFDSEGERILPLEYLELAVGAESEAWLIVWNDAPHRKHSEVLAAVDRAIALAEISFSDGSIARLVGEA